MAITLKGISETYTQEEINGNREAWIEALTDGSFKQAQGRLQKDGGFCCLGVACEVLSVPVQVEKSKDGVDTYYLYEDGTGVGEMHYAPSSVVNALGLRDRAGAYGKGFGFSG